MTFSFTSLGSASAMPTVDRFPSAHVLNVHERLFLIDCGEGCQLKLRKYGFSFLKIHEIFISHLHGDHIFGLWGLLSTMSMLGRTADITIFAPVSFGPVLDSFLKHFGAGFLFKVKHVKLKGDDLLPLFETKSAEVYAFPLNHRIDCFGFLFREKKPPRNIRKHLIEPNKLSLYEIARLKEGSDVAREDGQVLENDYFTYLPYNPRSFAYCSDTAPFEGLKDYVEGCDLLYHEATFASDLSAMARKTMHSTATDAARCALDAKVAKLVIGHFSSRYKNTDVLLNEARDLFLGTYIAQEGMVFEVPLVKPYKSNQSNL
jgi:ribonuclease Z